MKTSVIEVHDMLSVLSVQGVEEKIGEVPGVESATVNYAAGSATVRYDETRLELADIKSSVRQSAFVSDAPTAASKGDNHENHTAPGAPIGIPRGRSAKGFARGAGARWPENPAGRRNQECRPGRRWTARDSTALTPAAAAPQRRLNDG